MFVLAEMLHTYIYVCRAKFNFLFSAYQTSVLVYTGVCYPEVTDCLSDDYFVVGGYDECCKAVGPSGSYLSYYGICNKWLVTCTCTTLIPSKVFMHSLLFVSLLQLINYGDQELTI